jgi:choline kinase
VDAVIYAAGRAIRLGPDFADRPKILLEVGGRTLLEWHAERLAAAGVQKLYVVTGHRREQIAAMLPTLSARHGIQTYELHNPDFTEGSVVSMQVSLPVLELVREPILLMDGDVIYAPELLQRLLQSRHPSAMLIDFSYRDVDDDPVLVPIRDGRPIELVKQWRGEADRVGESVGFFKFAAEHLPALVEGTRRRLTGLSRRDSLDEVLRDAVKAGLVGFEEITGLPWTEIDFPHDVEYARTEVIPALAGQPARK